LVEGVTIETMKTFLFGALAVSVGLSAISCTRQTTSAVNPATEPILPQADFVLQPSIQDNKLKTEISFSKQDNQNITFTVTLQTQWQINPKDELNLEDVKIISQGYSYATSTQPTFSKSAKISLNDDMAYYKLSPQTKKVRLKVVVAQAGSTPEKWQQAKARVFFSKWLSYKSK
jgi:hypothetical protein